MTAELAFSTEEREVLAKLDTPEKVQKYLNTIDYNLEEDGETCLSPRKVLRERKANCIEGAIFAAAALRFHGYPPLIVDLTSVRDDDHIVAVFKQNGQWGTIAKSKYTGLGYREPIHKTIRELAISYFEGYFNFNGEKTLRGFSRPINLARFGKIRWMTSERDLFCIGDHLRRVCHKRLLTGRMVRGLSRVNPLMKEAGELWMIKSGKLERIKSRH